MSVHPISKMLDEHAYQRPDVIAIDAGPRRITWRQLARATDDLGRVLVDAGVQKGSTVAAAFENHVDLILALLGIFKSGGAFVPLSPEQPSQRLGKILEDAAPRLVLTDTGAQALVASVPAQKFTLIECRDGIVRRDGGEAMTLGDGERPAGPPAVEFGPEDLAYVYFTSGSTGRPKGVAGRLESLVHFIRWEISEFGIGPGDRGSQLTPVTGDPFLRDVLVPLCAGGTVCVPPHRTLLLDGAELARWIDAEQITLLHCVPSLFRLLLGAPLVPDRFQSLRHILLAGEQLFSWDVQRWMAAFGTRTQLVNLYGPTETTLARFFHRVRPEDGRGASVPIGRPIPDVDVLLLDEDKRRVAPGEPGELYIRTRYRSHGYYRRPEETSQVFLQNPFSDDPTDIIYKTGDHVRLLPDGLYQFVGRVDDQIKIHGNRVELGEVQAALREHPGVEDAAVIARDSGGGELQIVGYVVPLRAEEPPPPREEELRDFVAQRLERYMVPHRIAVMDSFPRTPTGKVDRKALPDVRGRRDPGSAGAVPQTDTEEKVAALFAELLGVDQVRRDDSFFRLGGDSIKVGHLVQQLRERLGQSTPAMIVYETSTVARLSAWLDAARARERQDEATVEPGASQERSLVLLQEGGAKRPLFLMHGASGMPFSYSLLQRYLDPDRPVYSSMVVLERQRSVRTLEEQASIYMDEIRKVQREGPYLLGGWSYGGALAYEVGRQLMLGGDQVSHLLLFDAAPPAIFGWPALSMRLTWALEWIAVRVWPPYRVAGRLLDRVTAQPPSREEAIDLLTGDLFPDPIGRERARVSSSDELFRMLEERLRAHLPSMMVQAMERLMPPWMKHGVGFWLCMKIQMLNSVIGRRYTSTWRYPGKITFFAYSQRNFASVWQERFARQPMDVKFVDLQWIDGVNPHEAMFMPENLKLFAGQLREVLAAEP